MMSHALHVKIQSINTLSTETATGKRATQSHDMMQFDKKKKKQNIHVPVI